MYQGKRSAFLLLLAGALVSLLGITGCGGGGSSSNSSSTLPQASIPPVASLDGWTPNDSTLVQYKTYTFAASATDPNIGGAITEFHWDFGDGTTKVTPVVLAGGKATTTVTYSYVASGTPTLSVVAKNSASLLSPAVTKVLTVGTSPSPLTVTFTSPTAATLINAVLGNTVTITYKVNVVYTGFGNVSASGVTLDPGETGATKAAPVDAGGGNYTIAVTYAAATAIGSRTVTPSVKVVDSNGVSSTSVSGPAITIKTVSATNTAPIITLSSDAKPSAGPNATWQNVDVVFTAVASDPDSDPLTYTWDLGDGTVITGSTDLTQTHKYAKAGLYSVKVTADDGRAGGTKTADLTMNVLVNRAPTVVVTKALPSGNPTKYQRVTLNAAVADLDGDLPTVTWDFGDGTASTTGASVVHQFKASGVSTITATADDGKGGVTSGTLALTIVENNPPVTTVTAAAPLSPLYQNKVYSFSATASDIDTGDTIASYEWDFGDGVVVAGGASQTHTFPPTVSGVVPVKARAIDSRGAVGDWSPAVNFTVAATKLPAVAFLVGDKSTFQATSGGQVIAEFLVSVTNPNGAAGTYLLPSALTVTAGDSAGTVGTIINHLDGTYTIPVKYLAAGAVGTRSVFPALVALDGLGVASAAVAASATVNTVAAVNTPPVATLVSAPKTAAGTNATWQNVDVVFTATATDPDSDPLMYTWDFGDGTVLTGMLGASALTQTHRYASAGNFSVKLTADDGRLSGTKTADLTMNVLANVAPTVVVTKVSPSGNPTKYQRVTLNAAVTDADPTTVTWNFGDASASATGTTVVHQFLAAGLTNVTATADDGKGGTGSGSLQLTIVENNPPVASVTTASATLYQKKIYTFNGTGSDPDASDTIASYEWDFGDATGTQTSLPITAGTTSKDHAYAATFSGPVSVRVRAIDSRGAVGDWSPAVTFTVLADVPPSAPTLSAVAEVTPTTAAVTLGAQLYQNKDYTFTASAATAGTFPVATYAFDFGDGTPIVPGPITQTHRYAPGVVGPVLVKVQALDSNGLAGAFGAATSFPISTSKPVVTFLSPLAPQTSNVTFNAVTPNKVTVSYLFSVTNPNGGAAPALTFVAGDSLTTTVTPSGTGPYLYQVAYLQDVAVGSRLVSPTVVALDHLGVYSVLAAPPAITIQTVAAGDTPPVINLTATPALLAGPNTTWQGVPVTFTATASDADNDPLVYSWDFGDTQTVGTTPLASALTQTHAFTPAFATATSFDVKVTADDGRGGGNAKTADLTMNILPNTAPTISINAVANPVKYQVVTFTATVNDPESDPVTVTWNFGDGSAAVVGNPVTHQFTTAGPVTVTATADDSKGNGGQGFNGTALPTATVALIVGADAPPAALVTTPAATLYQNLSYTFTVASTDPDPTDFVVQYQWDFGDGTPFVSVPATLPGTLVAAAKTQTHSYASTFSGPASVRVRAMDNHYGLGNWSPAVTFTVQVTPLPVVTFLSPGPTTLNVDLSPATVTQAFTFTATNPRAGSPGITDPIPVGSITFATNDAAGSVTSSVSNGGGSYTFTVQYTGAGSAGTRTTTPTASAKDSLGIQGLPSTGPAMTIKTLGANHTPSITITDPATPTATAYTSRPFSLGFTLMDADDDPVTYTVDWGDGTSTVTGTPTGDFVAGVGVALTHTYLDAYTSSTKSAVITVNATDNRSANANAVTQIRTLTVTFNTLPTATITSPQASGVLPALATIQDGGQGLPTIPAGSSDPDVVVIPAGGKLAFSGTGTSPATGGGVNYAWTFNGGVPSTSTTQSPGEVFFPGVTHQTIAYRVDLMVTDNLGRPSVNSPKARSKWVVVDGNHTQDFSLSFMYRQKSDSNLNLNPTVATLGSHGLGAQIQVFQDGVTNTWAVVDASGTQAKVAIPVRSDLPFWIKIPSGVASDPRAYFMRIPNAPTGAYADATLGSTLDTSTSSFGFASGSAPWNPTLQIVTAQGFAPEVDSAAKRELQGLYSLALPSPTTTLDTFWLNRMSAPFAEGVTTNLGGNAGFSGITAYQSFAEWPIVLEAKPTGATAGLSSTTGSTDLAFNLDYGKYQDTLATSASYGITAMQAFRAPKGSTDPYDLTVAGWGNASAKTTLTSTAAAAGVGTYFGQMITDPVGTTRLTGGISGLSIPYDANDPDRGVIAPSIRNLTGIRSVFSYAEYLWTNVWAWPLVLNSAQLKYDANLSTSNAFYRYSVPPTSWPKYLSTITPDSSSFNLNVSGGATFAPQTSSPVAISGTPGTFGVGRFFWTIYTPYYNSVPGATIARTWLADASGQPPTTQTGLANPTGDATAAMGFVPPQDTVVDKRGRSADGSLSGDALGGYRVTWFNATKDDGGNPVPPDFWVVELVANGETRHFLLPGSFPATYPTYSPSGLPNPETIVILTDARVAMTRQADSKQIVAPGYCWFDVPLELRPAAGSSATLTVFALKSVLANNAPTGARALNRPEWVDAIKTAAANMVVKGSNGTLLTDIYKIPFNYFWDIVITNGPATPVAP